MPTPCAEGYYSGAGKVTCTSCPEGYRCPNGTSPQQCPQGHFAPSGSVACQSCPAGHRCPSPGLAAPESCPEGSYTNQTLQVACSPCEAGRSCLNGDQSVPCPAGYFSRFSESNCTTCESGYYSSAGSSVCKPCPAGKQCIDPSQEPVNCSYGTFSGGGQRVCKMCPQGNLSVQYLSKHILSFFFWCVNLWSFFIFLGNILFLLIINKKLKQLITALFLTYQFAIIKILHDI